MGSSDVLVDAEYGNLQGGLQFVSPWWVGIRMERRRQCSGTEATSDAWRGVDVVVIKLVELASAGFQLSIVSHYADGSRHYERNQLHANAVTL